MGIKTWNERVKDESKLTQAYLQDDVKIRLMESEIADLRAAIAAQPAPLGAASIAPFRGNSILAPEADEFVHLMTVWRFAHVGDEARQAFDAVVAYIDAQRATLAAGAAPEQPEGYVLALQTVVGMPDGKNELGYTILEGVGIFETAQDVSDAIAELSLPLGWVSMTTHQLLPGWMLPAPPPEAEAPQAGDLSGLWMHEYMARDATSAVVNLPRKELQAAYSQARDDLANWRRRALEAEAPQAAIDQQAARWAIVGAIAYGRIGINKPPSTGHWLNEFWQIGQQLAALGATSAWDNVTPVERAIIAPVEALRKAFMTLESNGDNSRTIVLKFNQRDDDYVVHSYLVQQALKAGAAQTTSSAAPIVALSDADIDTLWRGLPGINIHNAAAAKGIDTAYAVRIAFARAIEQRLRAQPASGAGGSTTDFERGYFCAVSVLLREVGADTSTISLFGQGGDPTKADACDIELFREHGLMPRPTAQGPAGQDGAS